MTKTLTTIATFTIAATLAYAPAQAETFDGPYVGVSAGYSRIEIAETAIDNEVSRDALSLGGYAGYNYKVTDSIVIGAEAGINTTVDDKITTQSAGVPLTINPLYGFDISARAGYLVTEKALVYARGGYTNNRIRATLDTAGVRVSDSDNLDGWQIGGGGEYAITNHISARAEYRYSDIGQEGGKFDRHQVLVGVAYNF